MITKICYAVKFFHFLLSFFQIRKEGIEFVKVTNTTSFVNILVVALIVLLATYVPWTVEALLPLSVISRGLTRSLMTRSYAEVLINGMKINKINKGYTSIMFLDLLVQRSWFIGSAVSIFLNQVFETFVDMELSHEYGGK